MDLEGYSFYLHKKKFLIQEVSQHISLFTRFSIHRYLIHVSLYTCDVWVDGTCVRSCTWPVLIHTWTLLCLLFIALHWLCSNRLWSHQTKRARLTYIIIFLKLIGKIISVQHCNCLNIKCASRNMSDHFFSHYNKE